MTDFTGLNIRICGDAFRMIWPSIFDAGESRKVNKLAGNMVVLRPGVPYESKYRHAIAPDGEIMPEFFDLVLWERHFGEDEHDIEKYVQIARAKAFVSFLTGMRATWCSRITRTFSYQE